MDTRDPESWRADVLRNAVSFVAALPGEQPLRFESPDLVRAAAAARLMEVQAAHGRLALVYAVTPQGREAPVPRVTWLAAIGAALAALPPA